MRHCKLTFTVRLACLALVALVITGLSYSLLPADVVPARAQSSFSATMNCPNNVSYSFTNDSNTTNQYFIIVTDSQGYGLGSTAYSIFLKPGESLSSDDDTILSLDLVRVPSAGDLTATLWQVTQDGEITSVSSVTLPNCWPPSLSTPGPVTTTDSTGTPSTSRIQFTCTATGIDLSLTDNQNRALSPVVTFENEALLAAGPEGIYRPVRDYGILSVAGTQSWDGMYYYAAWNGGIYNATGQNDFSLTFKCTK